MLMRKISAMLAVLLIAGLYSFGQVTTSSISGIVVSDKSDPLTGASIEAVHQPTGSKYTTISGTGGRFFIPNIVPGGPYTITVTFVGLTTFTKSDVYVPLGDKFDVSVELSSSGKQLETVVVSATRSAVVKTGAATNVNTRQIQNLPNIGRSLTGVTKVTPQSNGNSFAGMNYRYNNITIDGALFNNNFGRSGDGLIPGGGVSAISIETIDQIQVNIAPYDVRQAGFVGGGINAVTKRGTNTFAGTVYGFYRNQNFNGSKVNDVSVPNVNRSTKIYGASLGGPIIKNKLFFFGNIEKEIRTQPGQTFLAKKPGVNDTDPNTTPVLASDLDQLAQYLKSQYNYDPGQYDGYNFATDNIKFVVRLDWNISTKHKLTVRYNQSETNDDDQVNSNSGPNPRFSNSRRGSRTGGLAFAGANFKNNTKLKSFVGELNSVFSKKISNQFIGTYTRVQPVRVPASAVPFVDIMDGSNLYTSFGTDLFSYDNRIDDKAFTFANNTTFNLGKHTVTAGVSYDNFAFENAFSDYGGPSYYRFASLQDFLNNAAPTIFAVTYGYGKDPGDIPPAAAKFAQLGFYAQDAVNVNNNFKLTFGLRVDKPLYTYDAQKNPALAQVVFKDENGDNETFDVSQWPKSRLLFSPRIGFNWDIEGDKNLTLRGGTGIFTGRIPFIWLVNQVGDNGVLRSIYTATSAQLANIRYSTDRAEYYNLFTVPQPGTSIPAGSPSYSATDQDFKMPQVWRTNLAVDKRLGKNYVFTVEGIFTKTINNVYFRNANLGSTNGVLANPGDMRPAYNSRLNSNINTMTIMDNINKGLSFAATAQLQKTFANNWEGFVAYTYTFAQDLNIGTSDRAASSWSTNNIVANPNRPELGYSNFSVPNRIVASLSYKFEYLRKNLATTVSLIYSGSAQERYHFRYNSDVNGDGQTNDLLYIPKSPSEITFQPTFTTGGVTYTAAQQSAAFFNFIENNKYLSKHKGQYVERYGAMLPWVNSLDMRILQDFSMKIGSRKHTLQFSADFVNFLNLLSNKWGLRYRYNFGGFSDQGILGLASGFNRSAPVYTFNPGGPTKLYDYDYSTFSTWGIQLGLRYIF